MKNIAKYKIGITEAGDAGIDLRWVDKLSTVDGAIVITKCVSPALYDAAMKHMEKLIVHATFTGYGHSILEPCVPPPYEELDAICALVKGGFPKDKVVIRVDPIIPTNKGLDTALAVIESFMDEGFGRFRISVIDMYPHVRERFKTSGLPLPYGEGFAPSQQHLASVDAMLQNAKQYWIDIGQAMSDLRIEACAEPGLRECIQCGCISEYDLALLGLSDPDMDEAGYQRKNCMCYSGKTELLTRKHQCPHGCLYCYWK